MSSEVVFNKLICTPKSAKTTDLLTDSEYSQLRTTTFEDFLSHKFNADTLEKLCSSEKEQLLVYYTNLEKKFERNKKRICRKLSGPTPPSEPKVVARYVPAPTVPKTIQITNTSVTSEGEGGLPSVIENIESLISKEPVIENVNVSIAPIELSQVMAPKELLMEEPSVQTSLADLTIEELDLGPPGDAGAFLGTSLPMPIEDSQVREQLMREFPSLRRPEVGGRFEDLEEVPTAGLMPPPVGRGISTSTPISSLSFKDIRRHLGTERSQLEATEMSAIKAPAPIVDTQQRCDELPPQVTEIADHAIAHHETELPSVPGTDIQIEELSQLNQTNVDDLVASRPVELEYSAVVPVPVLPVPDMTIPPEELSTPSRAVPVQIETSSSSNSSIERPQRVPRSIRKAPVYGNASIALDFQLRKNFEIDYYDDWNWCDAGRIIIQDALALCENRIVIPPRASNEPRESLAADIERNTILRELTSVGVDINSIREQPGRQSKLYPIPERPQLEDLQASALPEAIPIPLAENLKLTEVPANTIQPDSLLFPEVSLVDTNRELDIALIDRSVFPDVSNLESIQIEITNADGEKAPQEADVAQESIRASADRVMTNEHIQEAVRRATSVTIDQGPTDIIDRAQLVNNEKLSTIFRLYLSIQNEVKCSKRNSVLLERVSEIVGAGSSRLNHCKLFSNLLTLKRLSFVDIGMNEQSHIRNVVLRY